MKFHIIFEDAPLTLKDKNDQKKHKEQCSVTVEYPVYKC